MAPRLQLQTLLNDLEGVEKAYYQPPSHDKMVFPCIVYELTDEEVKHADNKPYNLVRGYQVTAIDRDPDSLIPGLIANLPMSAFQRFFVTEGLNHFVYKLFF